MARINLLGRDISELIAAGEVIERPASVIKELVENSIDAGATDITVEIKNGGISFIRVTDNGSGIEPEDIPTAFLRHATSKVHTANDLDEIATLGFRGEALASVSAVSRVEIISKTKSESYGVSYSVSGLEQGPLEQVGCPDGTTIIVRDLFYNTPARLKFLKKNVSEGNYVSAILDKIALSHPEVSIRFIRDNKSELATPGDGDLYSAIYAVLGRTFAQTLIPVDYTYEGIHIKGYTCKPVDSRANRTMQHFFVNGRYVRSKICTVAVEEAYKGSIMTGKFPSCVLNIEIPYSLVDVNAHPTKTEVRFSNEKIIFDSLYFVIKSALLQEDKPQEIELKKPAMQNFTQDKTVFYTTSNKNANANADISYLDLATNPEANSQLELNSAVALYKLSNDADFKYISTESFAPREVGTRESEDIHSHSNITSLAPSIQVIGELFGLYILAEAENELVLIDKHAAHERIMYERFKKQSDGQNAQVLLVPVSVTLSKLELDALVENEEVLTNLGFRIECDSLQAQIFEAPSLLAHEDTGSLVEEIAINLVKSKSASPAVIDDIYHSMACKAAIRARDKSTTHELQALADEVYCNDSIRYCPHGRPIVTTISKRQLEKYFNR
ncbi:MAG TPA: DNA mismatch repair endonuclease MutL [Oscillospiraceae bacterium]|nr:DNA mismatch repair endonuclease MutL [Oscillospiraceae bacterium]